MTESKRCAARQESDQMRCVPCGVVWDMNDPEPPQCRPESARVAKPPVHSALPEPVQTGRALPFVSGAFRRSGWSNVDSKPRAE